MGENIDLVPAGQIQFGPRRQKFETAIGKLCPVFPLKPGLQFVAQRVQMQDVRCRIGKLDLAQFFGGPVGGLLLLGNIRRSWCRKPARR